VDGARLYARDAAKRDAAQRSFVSKDTFPHCGPRSALADPVRLLSARKTPD